jgi:hypothetical protein
MSGTCFGARGEIEEDMGAHHNVMAGLVRAIHVLKGGDT